MSKRINTISRFTIAIFFIARGMARVFSYDQLNQTIVSMGIPIAPVFMALIIGVELSGGLFLFFGYRTTVIAKCMIVGTLLVILIFQVQLLQILNNLAIIAGLMLLINSGGGETFWEYAQTDIKDLPDYKTRL